MVDIQGGQVLTDAQLGLDRPGQRCAVVVEGAQVGLQLGRGAHPERFVGDLGGESRTDVRSDVGAGLRGELRVDFLLRH